MTERHNVLCLASHCASATIIGGSLVFCHIGLVSCAPSSSLSTPVHTVPVGQREPVGDAPTGIPTAPRRLSTLREAVGTQGQPLTQLLVSLGFSKRELELEEICGEGATALTGGLESVEALSANLDQDPDDEWIVWLTIRLAPAIPTVDPPPLRGMPRALIVFDRTDRSFDIVGRRIVGSVLTRDFDVSVDHVHDRSAKDMLVVETFDACLADPRDVLMRDHTLLAIVRGRLEAIWETPSSRQGPWAYGEEPPPAAPVFEGDFPKSITCASCYFRSRTFRFDFGAFRYVEVGSEVSDGD